MKKIISVLIIFLVQITVYGSIKYYSNDYADVVVDVRKNDIVFFIFGGSTDGSAADFALNSTITKNKFDSEMVGFIQKLKISAVFDYEVERLDRQICVKFYEKSLKITQLDCEGLCPLFSRFLGIYEEKNTPPLYLIDLFSENPLDETNLLYDISKYMINNKSEFRTITVTKQYLYNNPNDSTLTKMYLIKGDKVEVLKRNGDGGWVYVLFRGKRDIKKWIPISSLN